MATASATSDLAALPDLPRPAARTIWTPAAPPARPGNLMQMLLLGHRSLNDELHDQVALPRRILQLIGLAVVGFALHGAAVGLALQRLHGLGLGTLPGHPALWLPVAFTISLIGALGICLPIFFFCSQMAGLDTPLPLVAAQALRANATSAILLFALLPFYVALALGTLWVPALAPAALYLGFGLPLLAGLGGIRAVYLGFADLAQRQSPEGQRRQLLLVMVLCASVVYALVAPVAMYRLAEVLGHVL